MLSFGTSLGTSLMTFTHQSDSGWEPANVPAFHPYPLLRNRHVMTIVTNFWKRSFPHLQRAPKESRLVDVGEESKVLAQCHWQQGRSYCATVLIVHGLEGSAERFYVLGAAEKAWRAGFNVVRMNVRNCGDTEHLSATLYDSGLSRDLKSVAEAILAELKHAHAKMFLLGFSMGGNQALKLAGELGEDARPWLKGIVAISPALDLAACAETIHRGFNRVYEWRFLFSLLRRMKKKTQLFPGRFDLSRSKSVRTLRDFDEVFTGPYQGYGNADQYYAKASAVRVIDSIRVPTLIIHAQDDPFVPYACLAHPAIQNNPQVRLLTPEYGGHVGFVASKNSNSRGEDRYWAENRAIEFFQNLCRSTNV